MFLITRIPAAKPETLVGDLTIDLSFENIRLVIFVRFLLGNFRLGAIVVWTMLLLFRIGEDFASTVGVFGS